MKISLTILVFIGVLFTSPYQYSKPDFNGSTPGCGGSGCHSTQAGILTITQLGNYQVRITVSGTTSKVAGELVDAIGNVVAYINSTSANPFTLTAPASGYYTINAGYKNPSLRWDSAPNVLILPVELISFNAVVNGNTVNLKWVTATETNNYGFDIEKSENKIDWEKIGFVNGAGNSSSTKNYSFNEKNTKSGKYFYRLKQIDIDGTFEYSSIVEVNVSNPQFFSLSQNYPNPFNPSTIIKYQVSISSKVLLMVYDVSGNEVAKLVDELKEPGIYEVNFHPKGLTSGIYFYKLKTNSFVETKKMILLH